MCEFLGVCASFLGVVQTPVSSRRPACRMRKGERGTSRISVNFFLFYARAERDPFPFFFFFFFLLRLVFGAVHGKKKEGVYRQGVRETTGVKGLRVRGAPRGKLVDNLSLAPLYNARTAPHYNALLPKPRRKACEKSSTKVARRGRRRHFY